MQQFMLDEKWLCFANIIAMKNTYAIDSRSLPCRHESVSVASWSPFARTFPFEPVSPFWMYFVVSLIGTLCPME